MKKKPLRIVLWVVVVLVLLLGATWVMIDRVVKQGIERGGEYALGVPTTVKDVKLSLINGTLMMDTLNVGNPSGYTSPHLMQSGRFDLQVKPSSVLGPAIEITKFELNGLDVNIEQKGGTNNVSVVMDHVKALGGGETAKPSEGGKKVKVDRIVINNVVAHVRLAVPGTSVPLTVHVPQIVLENVTSDDSSGVVMSQLIARVTTAVMAAIVDQGKGIIPADLAGALSKDISAVAASIGGTTKQLLQQTQSQVGETVQKTAEAAKEVQKGVGEQLKGIFQKKEPNKP